MGKTVHRRKRTRGGSRKNRKTMKHGKPVITVGLIYANWCGHCKALHPEWAKMKKGMRGVNCNYLEIEESDKHKDRKIAHVNSRLKGEKLVANGYPTIFKIQGGNLEYYQGERNAPELQQWFKGGDAQQVAGESVPEPPVIQQPLLQRLFGGKKQKGGCGCGSKSVFEQ